MLPPVPPPVLRAAGPEDRAVLERLWLMFRHDLSEHRGLLPDADGTFRSDRLHASLDDPDRAAHLVLLEDRPAGLALVRARHGPVRVLSSFFVVRGARRSGVGLAAVRELLARDPGRWEVAFQDDNAPAVAFWRRVATSVAGSGWTEEHRPVPGRPDLPPDTWITLEVPG